MSWTSIGSFGLVGLSGIAVNQLLMWGLVDGVHLNYLVAAVLASAGSTTSNFVLTEAWVFRSRRRPGVGRRYLGFIALTAATTPVRIPVLFVLTSVLGIHYLLSNLVALGSVFGGRYLVSNLFIWGNTRRPIASRQGGREHEFRYDIDGLVHVVSDLRLPELEFFRTGNHVEADLIVRRGVVGGLSPHRRKSITADEQHLIWREQTGGLVGNFRIDFGPPVVITVAPLLGLSRHVVYTNLVEPMLRFLFVKENRMLLHAATIVINGQTVTLSAKTDTGKTGTILRLLQAHGGEFYSDDMVILHQDGMLSRYPKPLTISAHTVRAVPSHRLSARSRMTLPVQSRLHSRQGRSAGKWLGTYNLPIMSMNAIVQAVCPPPKYAITDLVDCQIGVQTALRHVFIIDRGEDSETSLVDLEASAQALSNNTDDAYGFPPYASLIPFLKVGGMSSGDLARKEKAILNTALAGIPVRRIVVQDYGWAAVIERHVGLATRPEPEPTLDPVIVT